MNESIVRNRRALLAAGLIAADAVIVLAALFAADGLRFHLLRPGGALPHMAHADLLRSGLLTLVAFLPAIGGVGLLEMRRGWSSLDVLFSSLVAVCVGGLGFLALSYMVKQFAYSRLMIWIFCLIAWLGLASSRLVVKRVLRWCFQQGLGVLRVVVVGESPVARSLAVKVSVNSQSGLRVVGHLIPSEGWGRESGAGRLEDAFEGLQRTRPHVCLFAEPVHGRDDMTGLLARCQEEGIGVWLATDLHQRYSPRMELKEVETIPVIVVGSLRLATWERILKRAADIVISAALLVVASPFLIYAALQIRREIGRPVIFRQARVGFQGRTFTILKLRAVPNGDVLGALPASGAAHSAEGPRRSFCEVLRAYSLDEIPQLWNVLRGDMSLVGPRPETQDRVRRYNAWNRRRLQVKPGVTGMAQIAGVRGEQDFDIKSRYDVRYLESQSFLLDLQILLKTPQVIWRRRKARAATNARAVAAAGTPISPELGRALPVGAAAPGVPAGGYADLRAPSRTCEERIEC